MSLLPIRCDACGTRQQVDLARLAALACSCGSDDLSIDRGAPQGAPGEEVKEAGILDMFSRVDHCPVCNDGVLTEAEGVLVCSDCSTTFPAEVLVAASRRPDLLKSIASQVYTEDSSITLAAAYQLAVEVISTYPSVVSDS